MRLHLYIESACLPVPFNHLHQLTGAIHKWIGRNDIHDQLSLYSFSWLYGGQAQDNHLIFSSGAQLTINSYDGKLLAALIKGIQKDPYINFGLSVSEINIYETPKFNHEEIFHLASPILIKRRQDNKIIHYTYDNPLTDQLLTDTLKIKLRKAFLPVEGVSVQFQREYPSAHTKIAYYKNIGNKVNFCPVYITGSTEQISFAWNVGMGNSTGIGFGALK